MDKKFKIEYLPSAENDLEEIFEYIMIDSPNAALNLLNKIDETISKLGYFPEIGVVPKDRRLRRLGYRILIVDNYLIFYVHTKEVVEIRSVLHGKRNYQFLL